MHFAVVMSGGRGRRFWPLSRAGKAKQLIRLFGPKTLLELTVERLRPAFKPEEILVVTETRQYEETRSVLERFGDIKVLAEPVGKNTAACIAYAATYIRAAAGDAVLAVLPADHYVQDERKFRETILAGMDFVRQRDGLVTLGISPDRAATGFGYMKRGPLVGKFSGFDFYRIGKFTEKPSLASAESYLRSGDYLWNAGIFVFKASSILREIATYLPQMGAEFSRCERCFGTSQEAGCIAECYSKVPEISIDFGVMEKTRDAYVVPAEVGWDDLGNWDSFAKYLDKDAQGNFVRGRHLSIDSRNCVAYSDQVTIATIGLTDVAIIASQDAVLVMKREKGEEVKNLIDLIEKEGLTDLL